MSDDDLIPWTELSTDKQTDFARMLNKRFDAELSVSEARKYYGNPEKAREDFGREAVEGGPECAECFTTLHREDIPVLKATGKCPYCGSVLVR